jgi:Spy/CpxP family protein refolding chaperone
MFMTKPFLRTCGWKSSVLVAAACCALAHGQAAPAKPGGPIRGEGPVNRAPHQAPCWQQVGISKNAIDQRRSVEQNTRAQVEAVCADSSLTPQQKHARIKDIRQQARAQIESIISPQQQQELKACNAERNPGRIAAGGPKPPEPALGPCGEVLPAAPSAPKKDTPNSEQH